MGRIHVTAREEGRNIAFFIEDNGIGISEQQMAKFVSGGMTTLQQMYEESPETGERRGLGVGNVADRLRIHYGNGYGLILCSETGQGTIIKCLIPQTAGSDS
jgi:sensor histidine kinase YesM